MQSAEELRDLVCIQIYGCPFAKLKAPDGYSLGEPALTSDYPDEMFLNSNMFPFPGRQFGGDYVRVRLHPKPRPRTLTVEVPEGERIIAFVTDGPQRIIQKGELFLNLFGIPCKLTGTRESNVSWQPVRKLDLF